MYMAKKGRNKKKRNRNSEEECEVLFYLCNLTDLSVGREHEDGHADNTAGFTALIKNQTNNCKYCFQGSFFFSFPNMWQTSCLPKY